MSAQCRRWHRFVVLADVPLNGVQVEGFCRYEASARRRVLDLNMIAGGFIRYGYASIAEAHARLPELIS